MNTSPPRPWPGPPPGPIQGVGPTVEVADEQVAVIVDAAHLGGVARAVLVDHGVLRGELSLSFVDEDTMADLNQRYLACDGPTDVLAFPLDLPLDAQTAEATEATDATTDAEETDATDAEATEAEARAIDTAATDSGASARVTTPPAPATDEEANEMPVLLGDVAVCPAVAERNAVARSVRTEDELALLVVHGVLHVLGRDHAEPDEAAEMQAAERRLLARWHHVR